MGYDEIIDKIQAYSQLVPERYHPKMIVVYGSYARGTATEDSDIDIAVFCDRLFQLATLCPSTRLWNRRDLEEK